MTKIPGVWLLASAFAPLVAVLTLLRLSDLGWIGWLILGLCVLSVLLLFLTLSKVKVDQIEVIETKTVRRADERVVAFASSYVAPIVIALFGPTDAARVIGTIAVVGLLAIIYVRAGLYHLNPTLAVCGFRLYEVTSQEDRVTMVLSRAARMPQTHDLEYYPLGLDAAIQLGGRP